ncbi:MAG: rRNA maturation RNase YbeY [bacterium]|jgi:rRNA maturation RNase YbeY
MQVSISSTVKSAPKINGALFTDIKNKVLGKNFDLSLAFIGTKRMRKLNKEHRKKDYATDILSFNVDKNVGEIVINPDKARQKAPLFERTYDNYLKFIFIHGLFHLKGYEHSSRMESEEEKIRKAFKV